MGAALPDAAGGRWRCWASRRRASGLPRRRWKTRSGPQPRYLLKDTGGYVSLYTADGRGPLAQYDLLTRLLPEQDVLALQQGVPVQDEAELQQRLEDYGL